MIPLAIGFYLKHRDPKTFICIISLFSFLLVSRTRGAWIAVFLSLGYCALLIFVNNYFSKADKSIKQFPVNRNIASVIVMVFIMVTISFGSIIYLKEMNITSRFKSIFSLSDYLNENEVASGRVYFWKRTLPFMNDYPLLGSGPDTYGKLLINHGITRPIEFPKAHNEYLQMIITLGYPYLLIYLTLVSIILVRLFNKAFIKGDFFLMSLFCAILGYIIQAFFLFSVISTAPIYWGLLGIAAKLSEESLDNKKIKVS
jgi:O-antigen ligase